MTRPEALATLGLQGKPSKAAIKEAYRLLAQAWHPDKHGGDPRAGERFARFGEARDILLGDREPTEPQGDGAEPDEGKRRKIERVRRVAKMAASRQAKRTLVDLLGEPAAGALQGFAAALLGGLGGDAEEPPPPRRRRRRQTS